MKWIGQHIVDFIARFRSDVYLEDISTGTIASGGNLGLDSNNKVVKADEDGATLTTEAVQDIVGGMFSSNTETRVAATYVDGGDGAGKINVVVDDMTANTTYSIQDGELSQNNFTNADHTKLNGITAGISDGNYLTANDAVADDDFLRINGTEVEGRTAAQVLSDIGAQSSIGDGDLTIAFTDELQDTLDLKAPIAGPTFTGTVAIPNVANVETAITANTAKVTNSDQSKADINALDITEVGALASGTIASGFGNIDNGSSTLDTGAATVATLGCTAGASFGGGYGSTGATITTAGVGSFNGALTADSSITAGGTFLVNALGTTTGGRMLVREGSDNGAHYIGFQSPAALTASTAFILPDGDGSANQVLKTDGSANLAWTDGGGGTVGWHGSGTRIKILAKDFVANDGGRPIMIEDDSIGSNELYLFSHSTFNMFAYVHIPTGFKATHTRVYGSDTGQNFTTYEGDIDSKTIAIKGSATAIGTEKAITNVTSDTTNYLVIHVTSDGATDEIHGGYVTIAAV